MFSKTKKFLIVLIFPLLIHGIDTNINSLKKIDGFESYFYSPKTGLPYLKLKYSNISTVKPKLGFLKFGIAFLKIEDFSCSIDLKESDSISLFSKWDNISNQKAIKYATMEPISVTLIQLSGKRISLKATKGKFSSDGGLKLWGKVECEFDQKINMINELSVYFDPQKDSLVIIREKDTTDVFILPFNN